jgi:hypothetical protein
LDPRSVKIMARPLRRPCSRSAPTSTSTSTYSDTFSSSASSSTYGTINGVPVIDKSTKVEISPYGGYRLDRDALRGKETVRPVPLSVPVSGPTAHISTLPRTKSIDLFSAIRAAGLVDMDRLFEERKSRPQPKYSHSYSHKLKDGSGLTRSRAFTILADAAHTDLTGYGDGHDHEHDQDEEDEDNGYDVYTRVNHPPRSATVVGRYHH